MRIGYLHCFSGISGDMFLGALVDAGVSVEFLRETAQSLLPGTDLEFERVDRSGLSAIKVHVVEDAYPHAATDNDESATSGRHEEEHSHSHTHTDANGHSHTHEHQHEHSHGEAGHEHGRSLASIRALIEQSSLLPAVKQLAIHAFELLGDSESRMHDVPIEQVHFHEVGAVDAIIDIVCGCAGAYSLGVDQWVCSPLNVGSGMVRCAHGVFPVPAPATLDLLQGVPIYSEGPEGERVTPTGAALVRALGCNFGPMPRMTPDHTGYGAGARDPKDHPNVLRITLGESQPYIQRSGAINNMADSDGVTDSETVAVLETAIDDSTPQVIGFIMESALAAGALDVMMTPVHMKKNRPGTLITILCEPQDTSRFCELLFRQTSTIGVRTRMERRKCLEREIAKVDTKWGGVRVKVARLNGVVVNAAPEFEDCRPLALSNQVPLKDIQRDAVMEFSISSGVRLPDIQVAGTQEPGASIRT